MVKIYTSRDCHFCGNLKVLLKEEKIEYIDVDVDDPKNEKEVSELFSFTNSASIPIINVDNQLLVPNVSFFKIKDSVTLIKKLI